MLDRTDSGGESAVDSILNDSDTEFVSDKPISKIVDDAYGILDPEANVHVKWEVTEPQKEDCEVLAYCEMSAYLWHKMELKKNLPSAERLDFSGACSIWLWRQF